MDPSTVYLIASLMMLANGGVLGLMRRDLPRPLRPGAASWRIATLLIAGSAVLFIVQSALPAGFILPIANGLAMLGIAGYWHALRLFYGRPVNYWLLMPPIAGAIGIFLFAAIWPSLIARVLIASVTWLTMYIGCIITLEQQRHSDRAISRRVLIGIFIADAIFMLIRCIYFLYSDAVKIGNILDPHDWINVATPVMVAVTPVIGTTAFVLMCSERLRRQWEHAASTDYLTGLANRRTMTNAGESRFSASREGGRSMALAVVDIDHFKSVNDRYGHDIGDGALKHVAAQLEAACREAELPARQGGEEFVVLLDHITEDQAHAAGERLRQAVESVAFNTRDLALNLTVSIGVAVLKQDDPDFDNLLRRADEALYAAKAGGRNRVELAA